MLVHFQPHGKLAKPDTLILNETLCPQTDKCSVKKNAPFSPVCEITLLCLHFICSTFADLDVLPCLGDNCFREKDLVL